MRDWTESNTIQWHAPPPASPPGFWPVRISKLLVLSILTLGIYELVWFWRNWRAINEAAPGSVNPYARTFFSGIMYFSLVERVGVSSGALLAVGYIALNAMARLPDPYWLISFTSVLFLLPTAVSINRLCHDFEWPASSRWRLRDFTIPLVGSPLLLLILVSLLIPDYIVQRGSEIDADELATLYAAEILADGEEILYYYAADPFDVTLQGAFISDLGLTTWWLDPITDQPEIAYMPYDTIVGVEVNYAETWFDDTWVRVTNFDGDWVHFPLSNEEERDKMFIGELRSRVDEEPLAAPAGDV